ncbi:hypothetical protein GKZ90_0023550 [Flavobacterium sp. MC2016-06]|jgi:hypothetical protein|uniref:hypothetical protein n=1 Tax=Flavobacterium sp. MC2016-06 TaxID=2676308 RepID=UPI0012BA9910|nr:hypothetical protein [Flavobacterium sp. MC2016-06]MBU3862480.1 hypothetical protein [Flavobacterium sp. MC2016-06]
MKKNILLIFAVMAGLMANAQSSIGKTTPDGSGLLDFNSGGKSGIVLPWVTKLPTGAALTAGVLLYDANLKKVVYYNGTTWVDLSNHAGAVDVSLQTPLTETLNGTVIGDSGIEESASSVQGVLVLESSKKALILPKVASPQNNIVKPMAGTICYDTVKKLVCVYNGTEWTFWK